MTGAAPPAAGYPPVGQVYQPGQPAPYPMGIQGPPPQQGYPVQTVPVAYPPQQQQPTPQGYYPPQGAPPQQGYTSYSFLYYLVLRKFEVLDSFS